MTQVRGISNSSGCSYSDVGQMPTWYRSRPDRHWGQLYIIRASQCDKYDGMDTQDFANVHHYGALTDMRAIIKMLDRRFDGKSITLGEFGSAIAHRARTSGRWGDTEKESVNHYLSVGHCCLGMGVSFMGNWSWKDFQDCVFPWGINHADLTPKAA